MDNKERRFKNMVNIERRETVPTEEAVGMENSTTYNLRVVMFLIHISV